MASRILGMGDMLTLIEKAQTDFDEKKAQELEKKFRTQKLTLTDFYDQLCQMKKLGSLQDIMGMLPGMNPKMLKDASFDEKIHIAYRGYHPFDDGIRTGKPFYYQLQPTKKGSQKDAGLSIEEINRALKAVRCRSEMIEADVRHAEKTWPQTRRFRRLWKSGRP